MESLTWDQEICWCSHHGSGGAALQGFAGRPGTSQEPPGPGGWGFPWPWGYPTWMVFARENPIARNGRNGGWPGEPPWLRNCGFSLEPIHWNNTWLEPQLKKNYFWCCFHVRTCTLNIGMNAKQWLQLLLGHVVEVLNNKAKKTRTVLETSGQ